jgi:hypothetical protein
MMGRTTAGIVIDSVPLLLADLIQWVDGQICHSEGRAGGKIFEWVGGEIPDISDLKVDNMGRQTILY